MSDPHDVQALSKISSEVDDSQVKIYLSSQCIKAQAFLYDKLRKQTNTQKEIIKHVWDSNTKLEVEIKNAENEVKSLMLSVNAVKSANVELKKELALAKESKQEIIERARTGEKKYEALWLQCKTRYKSLPYVQKWLEATHKLESLNDKVANLTNNVNALYEDIRNKKRITLKTDQERIVTLANYIIHEIPNAAIIIKQKNDELAKIKKEIDEWALNKSRKSVIVGVPAKSKEMESKGADNWASTVMIVDEDSIMMPKLHLNNIDLDGLSAKLDQIKRSNSSSSPLKRPQEMSHERVVIKKTEIDNKDYFSTYFKESNDSNIKDFSRKKLINILEDVKLDDRDAFNIISKANPDKFHNVEEIKANDPGNTQKEEVKDRIVEETPKVHKIIENELIEEVDMSSSSGNNLIVPPSQFLDLSQERTKSQPRSQSNTLQVEVMVHRSMAGTPEKPLKKVSFDLPPTRDESDKLNDSAGSQLNISAASDSFVNIKNLILKEHNLDLSPQFVYSKNHLQKKDDPAVTSKFFSKETNNTNDIQISEAKEQIEEAPVEETADEEMKQDEIVVSSPKLTAANRQVCGFLFSHGAGALPDSLDVSLSTAGYDDNDIDYQCIDSSVLLSPKADVSLPAEADEPASQEGNFLSGLRKTGLSFFGKMALESKPEDTQDQSAFSFKFGSDDKKPRGGLFNMFR